MASEDAYAIGKVFVVIDPTRFVQPALEKAEWVAERNKASLHLYCCAYDSRLESDEAKQTAIDETEAWLVRVSASVKEKGIPVTMHVEWHPDWRTKIVNAALASKADLIVKTSTKHSHLARHLMKTSDWALLRNVASPTLLVNPNQAMYNNKPVLAAMKLKPNDEVHFTLNERVIEMARRIAAALSAELHAVTVYKGEEIYFDRQHFADSCQLPRNRVHAIEGTPHRGVAEIVKQIGAGVLVVGCASVDAREHGGTVTDTAQRVIDEVSSDVVVVPPGVAT